MTPNELAAKIYSPVPGLSSPTKLIDATGFSLVEDYGDGFASLYHFAFYKPLHPGRNALTVGVHYGKKTEGGIIVGTGKKGTHDPVDLNSSDEYFYDAETGEFFRKDTKIDPKKILLRTVKLHKLPTRTFAGMALRIRLSFWREFIPGIIILADRLTVLFLWVISGETNEHDIMERIVSEKIEFGRVRTERNTPPMTPSFVEGETLEFFGYKAKRWSVVFYCTLHLLIYVGFFFFDVQVALLSHISANNFLVRCYAVVTFTIIENGAPTSLKWTIKRLAKIYGKVMFMRLRIGAI